MLLLLDDPINFLNPFFGAERLAQAVRGPGEGGGVATQRLQSIGSHQYGLGVCKGHIHVIKPPPKKIHPTVDGRNFASDFS